jgi:UDP-N-acetylmuramate dehydrogenase
MIAITGLIGSGKSFISSIIEEMGFKVLDADSLAHKLYRENAELREKIREKFGDEAITESGINKKYIADLVFNDAKKLELLESIVHPIVIKEIEKINPPYVESAILYKLPEFAKKMEEIWVVEADESVRRERLLKKGLDIRMKMQPKELKFENEFKIKNNCSILRNVSLKKYNTFKIGCLSKFFAEPKNAEEILELLALCRKFKIPYFILGRGSNVLFSDEGFDGLIIKWGKSLHSLIQEAASQGFGGIEKLEGIPGTVFGAVYMNAGAHGQQISDCIKSVTSIMKSGEIRTRTKEECGFGYRKSGLKNEIIISVEFDFTEMPKEIINKNRREVLAWRREKQPLQYPNAGSIFKNPAGKSAGALIDSCGLKGYRIGDAQVSELHANFIVNRGNATAKDVKALMEKIIQEVEKRHGVVLEPEIIMPSSSSKI